MRYGSPQTTTRGAGNVLLPLLASVPSTCLTGALLTDIAYWQTANMQWANFSAWLLAVGLVLALFAALVGVIDFIIDPHVRRLGVAWGYVGGNVLAWLIAIVNSFIHSRDAYTEDVLTGFIDGDTTHGRPVGLAIDKTGALLVADDVGGTVWRVTAAGAL